MGAYILFLVGRVLLLEMLEHQFLEFTVVQKILDNGLVYLFLTEDAPNGVRHPLWKAIAELIIDFF